MSCAPALLMREVRHSDTNLREYRRSSTAFVGGTPVLLLMEERHSCIAFEGGAVLRHRFLWKDLFYGTDVEGGFVLRH